MYLLRAEAHYELQEYVWQSLFKEIHERAGISDTVADNIPDDQLGTEICEERMRELYLEGHNLYDWVRNGQLAGRKATQ